MGEVSIEDFAKLDLRVGRIVEVKEVPGSQKLWHLVIDLGKGKKIDVVAGIRPWYFKEQLLDKQVLVLTNIKPKKVKGVLSQGMILAAQDSNTVAVLKPDRPVEEGAKVF